MEKQFHIGDVISIATDRLMSPRHMQGVYDILNFMTDDDLCTHQIPRFMRECRPQIIKQFPQFSEINFSKAIEALDEALTDKKASGDLEETVQEWLLKILSGDFGIKGLPLTGQSKDMLTVRRLPFHDHERIDPESELLEKFPPDKIIKL